MLRAACQHDQADQPGHARQPRIPRVCAQRAEHQHGAANVCAVYRVEGPLESGGVWALEVPAGRPGRERHVRCFSLEPRPVHGLSSLEVMGQGPPASRRRGGLARGAERLAGGAGIALRATRRAGL